MERSRSLGCRKVPPPARAVRTLSALLLFIFLLLFSLPALAATDDGKAGTYEDRAIAEKMSRSRYRDLEVASLVVILVAGGAAIIWAVRRRKP